MAQLGARLNGIEKVVSSSLTGSTHNGTSGRKCPYIYKPGVVDYLPEMCDQRLKISPVVFAERQKNRTRLARKIA